MYCTICLELAARNTNHWLIPLLSLPSSHSFIHSCSIPPIAVSKLNPRTQTPIHHQISTTHKTRPFTTEPNDRVRNLARLPHPPTDILRQLTLKQLRIVLLHGAPPAVRNVDIARADGIGPHALRRQGMGQLRHVVNQRRLESAVGRRSREIHVSARDGGDGDDAALGAFEEREALFNQRDRAHDIDVERRVPSRRVVRQGEAGDIGHHDVDALRFGRQLGDPAVDLGRLGNVDDPAIDGCAVGGGEG